MIYDIAGFSFVIYDIAGFSFVIYDIAGFNFFSASSACMYSFQSQRC